MNEAVRNVINNSNNIVCLCGLGVYKENGYKNYRDDDEVYEIEAKYGYSPEEIFCATFYNTRTELFFKYYKENVLQLDVEPNSSFKSLARLESMGKLKSSITRGMHGTLEKAGCKNVVNLLGCVNDNFCPKCHKSFSAEYIKNSSKVPLCEKCSATIRPQITLMGEMISNKSITEAAAAISLADVLLVIGCNLNQYLSDKFIQYYNGEKLVLINEKPHFSDKLANYVVHERVIDVLPEIVDSL